MIAVFLAGLLKCIGQIKWAQILGEYLKKLGKYIWELPRFAIRNLLGSIFGIYFWQLYWVK